MDVINTNSLDYNAVIILPKTDQAITVEIGGLFYQKEMIEDADENYWSQVHPLLLIMSASRHIEIMHRNTQGKQDWDRAIDDYISGIGMDVVEEQIAENDEMEG